MSKRKKSPGTGVQPNVPSQKDALSLWIVAALVAVTVFVYAPVSSHSFVAWDDPEYVSENAYVAAGTAWNSVQWAFATGHMGNWHPITWLSYMVAVQAFGVSAGSQLLFNVVLHIANMVLLFFLLRKVTAATMRSAVVAALFAIHPLHVESVAWVSERKDVLSTLLAFLALWVYVDYTRRPARPRYLAALGLFVLGLMAKPMLVTLPALMLILDYWPLRQMAKIGWAALLREKAPFVAVAAIIAAVTVVAQSSAGAVNELTKVPLDLRLENALVSYAAYIGKTIWPANLSALYPLTRPAPGAITVSAIVLACITIATLRQSRVRPYAIAGWLWYVVSLAPVIGFIQVGSQAMADRYMYIPMIGLLVALVWATSDLVSERGQWRTASAVLAGILVLACAAAARAQVEYWKDSKALWTHALEATPVNDTAQRLLADELVKEGKYDEAITHYQEALRIHADYSEAHNGYGLALASKGRFEEALVHYRESLRLKPNLMDAHSNMGLSLASMHRLDEAIAQYREALRIKPQSFNTHNNLGVALANSGRSDDAIAEFTEVLRLKPDNADAHNNLGILLAGKGRTADAIDHFSAAVRLKPDFQLARKNLEIARGQLGNGAAGNR